MTRTAASPPARLAAWLVPTVLFVVTVGVHLALTQAMRTPIVHADEFGYLMDAHWMAHGGPRPGMPYSPGYPLLLVPLWLVSSSAATVYRAALDLNVILAGVTTVLLYALAGRLAPRSPTGARVAATVAVAAFPSLLLFSDVVESENLLVPGILVVCLLAHRALGDPRWWPWAAGVSAALVAVHPRAAAVTVAVVAVAGWSLRPWRANARLLARVGAVTAVVVVVAEAFNLWVTRVVPSQHLPHHGAGAGAVATRTLSASGAGNLVGVTAGEVLYLLVGTAGLVAVGVVALSRLRSAMAGFLGLSLAATAALSAVVLDTGQRVDIAVYGRYVEVAAVPVMLVGALAAVAGRPGRRPLLAAIALAGGGLVLAAATVALQRGSRVTGSLQQTNTFAVDHLFRMTGDSLDVWVFAAAGLGATALAAALYRWGLVAGTVGVIAVFLPATAYAQSEVSSQSTSALPERAVAAKLAAVGSSFGDPGCVAWDVSTGDDWGFFNTRLFDPATPFVVFDSGRGQPTCSPLVAGARDLSGRRGYSGARLVSYGHSPEAVWVLPGPLQSRLDGAGWLLPAGFPAALPVSAQRGSIASTARAGAAAAPVSVRAGDHVTVSLEVTHLGTGSPWPDAASVGAVPRYAVRVGIWWFRSGSAHTSDADAVATGRADLPYTVLPGHRATVEAVLDPEGPGEKALPPGDYDVRMSLIQESVTSFDASTPPLWLHVSVRP